MLEYAQILAVDNEINIVLAEGFPVEFDMWSSYEDFCFWIYQLIGFRFLKNFSFRSIVSSQDYRLWSNALRLIQSKKFIDDKTLNAQIVGQCLQIAQFKRFHPHRIEQGEESLRPYLLQENRHAYSPFPKFLVF